MTLSLFCTFLTLGLSSDSNTVPEWNYALGFVLGLVAAGALVQRHRRPWIVLAVTLLGPLLFSTDA
ncbi:histidine kinase, partial [Nocardia sp. NPDC050793]